MIAAPKPGEPAVTICFVSSRTSGAARRMESLVARLRSRERGCATFRKIDVDDESELVARLGVETVPSLVVLRGGRVVGRLSGPATMREIDRLVQPHLECRSEDLGMPEV